MENQNEQTGVKKSKGKVYIPLAVVILAVIVTGWIWYADYSRYIKTDDAYIDADKVSVSAKILGRISKLYVQEGDTVQKGMLLAELDSSELLAEKQQALAGKDQALAMKQQTHARYKLDQENIKVQEINFQKATDDYTRAQKQFSGGVITQESLDHIQKAFESAKAHLDAAQSELNVAKTQIKSAQASVQNAQAQIDLIETQLDNTRLYAPIKGVVAKRWLLPGDVAQPGQSIFTLTKNHNLWVTVYLEETNMANIFMHQRVKFTVDAFPGITFYGKIFSIGNNTASQFSLIPPSNASGNFTKVTQRVPIKISIAGSDKGKLSQYDLLDGMSVIVKIIRN